MAGIGVIFNPRSGRNLRDSRAAARLREAVGDHGVVRETASYDELDRVARDFRRQSIDVLAISGGDGTSGVALTGFLGVYGNDALPPVALLRGGTMNTVANAVGVRRGSPERLLRRLASAYAERGAKPLATVERHVLRLRGEGDLRRASEDPTNSHASVPPASAGRDAERYGFLFGTGAVYGYLAEYYRGGPPNAVIAAKTLLRGIGSALVSGSTIRRMAEPFRGTVELDDGTIWEERDYLAIAGATIDQIGLKFRPFYRCGERPGAFHLLGVHASPLNFVGQLPRIWRARSIEPDHAVDATTSCATVRSPKSPVRYMLDGDLHACNGPLHVTTGPRVRIIIGV